MAHLHFVAAPEFRQRVIQLGESPNRVFTVGAVGLDSIAREPPMSLEELQSSLGVELGKRNLLVTFHPVTLESGSANVQMKSLLAALDAFPIYILLLQCLIQIWKAEESPVLSTNT